MSGRPVEARGDRGVGGPLQQCWGCRRGRGRGGPVVDDEGDAGGFLTVALYAGLGRRHDWRAALGRIEALTLLATRPVGAAPRIPPRRLFFSRLPGPARGGVLEAQTAPRVVEKHFGCRPLERRSCESPERPPGRACCRCCSKRATARVRSGVVPVVGEPGGRSFFSSLEVEREPLGDAPGVELGQWILEEAAEELLSAIDSTRGG